MTDLADRLLEQLRRMGAMAAISVPLTFGVTEDEAGAAIDEVLSDTRAYHAGGRIFASMAAASCAAPPAPAAPPRQVRMPASPPPRGVRPAAAVIPRESPQEAGMADTKVCNKCEKRKPLDEFYREKDPNCKRCVLVRQKELNDAKAAGVGLARPKRPPPASPTAGAKANGAPSIAELAVIHIPQGFRIGPLHKTTAGLVHMPHYVDLSFAQLGELSDLRKAVKESAT